MKSEIFYDDEVVYFLANCDQESWSHLDDDDFDSIACFSLRHPESEHLEDGTPEYAEWEADLASLQQMVIEHHRKVDAA